MSTKEVTLLRDGFEGATLNEGLMLNGGASRFTWGFTAHRQCGGDMSLWCAAGRWQDPTRGIDPRVTRYPANLFAMLSVHLDLANVLTAQVSFNYWLRARSGHLLYAILNDRPDTVTPYSVWRKSGDNGESWALCSFIIPNDAIERGEVWLNIIYRGDSIPGTLALPGAYIDNLLIMAVVNDETIEDEATEEEDVPGEELHIYKAETLLGNDVRAGEPVRVGDTITVRRRR